MRGRFASIRLQVSFLFDCWKFMIVFAFDINSFEKPMNFEISKFFKYFFFANL